MSSPAQTNSIPDIQWEAQREYLKRLLISLTHDLDLAEDLLQETYVLARGGWARFRGGDVRAWLATIARNAFYTHCRKRYLQAEVPLDAEDEQAASYPDEHLLVDLRQALAVLPPSLRAALVMKHYGGFSYDDIAQRQHCPVGTAKWRVSSAIKRLQASLGITRKEKIMPIPSARLLDYLYGLLPEEEAVAVRATLSKNEKSREELQAMKQMLHTLDALESDVKCSVISVLDAEGGVSRHCFLSAFANNTPNVVEELDWEFSEGVELRAVLLQGQEVSTRVVGRNGADIRYKLPFPQPVPTGEVIGPVLLVTYEKNGITNVDEHCRLFRFSGTLGIGASDNWVLLHVVRLPPGATLISADPPADELKTNGAITLTWRYISSAITQSAPGQWPLAGEIAYRL